MGAPKGNKFALGNKGGKGGPAKYHTNYAKLAALAVAAGHTEIEVANLLCISTGTLWNWKIKHKEFAEAVKTGRVQINERTIAPRLRSLPIYSARWPKWVWISCRGMTAALRCRVCFRPRACRKNSFSRPRGRPALPHMGDGWKLPGG